MSLPLVLAVLLGPVVLAVAVLAGLRFWIHHVDTESLRGSDLHMLKWCRDENQRAWGGFHLAFEPGSDFAAITTSIRDHVQAALEDPRSSFRRDVDWERGVFTFDAERTVDDIVQLTDDDHTFFHTLDADNRPVVYRFHTERELMGVLFDHTVWDGVRIVNETVVPAISAKPFDTKWLLRDKYVPVVAELLQLYVMAQMGQRWLTHRCMETLPEERDQAVYSHHLRVPDVKAFKDRLGIKFAAALVAIYARMVFDWNTTDRKRIRMGVIIGMDGPRFRNNYSIITIDCFRDDDLDTTARKVDRQFRRRAIEVLPLYNLINTVEIQTLFKRRMIDCLFSPAFFDPLTGPSQLVTDMAFRVLPCSTPTYAFGLSIEDEITISTTRNTAELSAERMAEHAVGIYQFQDDKSVQLVRGAEPPDQRPELGTTLVWRGEAAEG